jgi:hypothetical protein
MKASDLYDPNKDSSHYRIADASCSRSHAFPRHFDDHHKYASHSNYSIDSPMTCLSHGGDHCGWQKAKTTNRGSKKVCSMPAAALAFRNSSSWGGRLTADASIHTQTFKKQEDVQQKGHWTGSGRLRGGSPSHGGIH